VMNLTSLHSKHAYYMQHNNNKWSVCTIPAILRPTIQYIQHIVEAIYSFTNVIYTALKNTFSAQQFPRW